MKRIVSILLVIAMFLTLFGCKAAPEEETAVPLDTAADVQTEAQEQTEEQSEQTEEQTEVQQQTENQDQEQTEEQTEQTEQQEETEKPEETIQYSGEKGKPCTATIDDEFTEDEIIVTIIKELSRTRESFTAEDFPGVDVKEARIIFSYVEKYDGNVTVGITLNNGTKQKVLDSIKILEQNPIVYSACPNYIFKLLN